VILAGTVAISAVGQHIANRGAGDFFGELAAVDWGAGFARTRSATVTAVAPTRLLVLEPVLVNRLMETAPGFAAQLEEASRRRLATL